MLLRAHDYPQAVRSSSSVDSDPLQDLVDIGLGEFPLLARRRAVPEVGTVGRVVDLAGLIPGVDRGCEHISVWVTQSPKPTGSRAVSNGDQASQMRRSATLQ